MRRKQLSVGALEVEKTCREADGGPNCRIDVSTSWARENYCRVQDPQKSQDAFWHCLFVHALLAGPCLGRRIRSPIAWQAAFGSKRACASIGRRPHAPHGANEGALPLARSGVLPPHMQTLSDGSTAAAHSHLLLGASQEGNSVACNK